MPAQIAARPFHNDHRHSAERGLCLISGFGDNAQRASAMPSTADWSAALEEAALWDFARFLKMREHFRLHAIPTPRQSPRPWPRDHPACRSGLRRPHDAKQRQAL